MASLTYAQRYYAEHKEETKARVAAYHAANREKRATAERARRLRRDFGMSIEDYEDLVAAQGGHCLVCRTQPDQLVVDHDHRTGEVRGLLCNNCNVGLGMFNDDRAALSRAVEYLSQPVMV